MNIEKLAEGVGLEEEDFMEILELFVDSGNTDIISLETASKISDLEGALKAAHSLKGAAANIGLLELSELAQEIEMKARDKDLTGVEEIIEALKGAFAQVIALFRT